MSTCGSCRHWGDVEHIGGERWGECYLISHDAADGVAIGGQSAEEDTTFNTREDFGCVRWGEAS